MARATPPLWAVIMAGGSGTRFWPVSRKNRPKQFLPLGGGLPVPAGKNSGKRKKSKRDSEKSLLRLTVDRLNGLAAPERTLVVGAKANAKLLVGLLPEIPKKNILLEPEGRNTLPCLGLAAHIIEGREPGAVMAVFPSDHYVERPPALRCLVRTGARLAAERSAIVILGIPPRRAETGYGYIRRGKRIAGIRGAEAYSVRRFTEKPGPATAKRFLASGDYYWNGGYFILPAARAIEEIDRFHPRTGALLRRGASALRRNRRAAYERSFRACEAISIDYGVMEKTKGIIVLPAEIGWDDAGSWSSLSNILPTDRDGNIWILPPGGRVKAVGARKLTVRSQKPLVAAVGVENIIVIETEDTLFLCGADSGQSISDLIKKLTAEGLDRHL